MASESRPRAAARAETPRPFLKWVGGKGQLLDQLHARVARAGDFRRYHEPFAGGGALFFSLFRNGLLAGKKIHLSDNNPRLIETYVAVRDDVSRLIELLREHKARHDHDHYYATRENVPGDATARAARIIYLNKTCFNGLYRENSKGLFNVPLGKYKNPLICDEENLRACAAALQAADIACRPFETVLKKAKPGDLVYFDPPYDPVSRTASFTSYDRAGFAEADQRRLAEVYGALTASGVKAVLSNSYTARVRGLYRDLDPRRERIEIERVFANRNVNSNAARRGPVAEALIRNF